MDLHDPLICPCSCPPSQTLARRRPRAVCEGGMAVAQTQGLGAVSFPWADLGPARPTGPAELCCCPSGLSLAGFPWQKTEHPFRHCQWSLGMLSSPGAGCPKPWLPPSVWQPGDTTSPCSEAEGAWMPSWGGSGLSAPALFQLGTPVPAGHSSPHLARVRFSCCCPALAVSPKVGLSHCCPSFSWH